MTIHLLETLESVARECQTPEPRQIIAHHARMTRRECQSAIAGEFDQKDVEERLERVFLALEGGI